MERQNRLPQQRQMLELQLINFRRTRDTCDSANRELFEILAECADRQLHELVGTKSAGIDPAQEMPHIL